MISKKPQSIFTIPMISNQKGSTMWKYCWQQIYAAEQKTFAAYEAAVEQFNSTPDPLGKQLWEKRIQAIQTALSQLRLMSSEEI